MSQACPSQITLYTWFPLLDEKSRRLQGKSINAETLTTTRDLLIFLTFQYDCSNLPYKTKYTYTCTSHVKSLNSTHIKKTINIPMLLIRPSIKYLLSHTPAFMCRVPDTWCLPGHGVHFCSTYPIDPSVYHGGIAEISAEVDARRAKIRAGYVSARVRGITRSGAPDFARWGPLARRVRLKDARLKRGGGGGGGPGRGETVHSV